MIFEKINIRKLKLFAILNVIIMFISVVIMCIINYIHMHYDRPYGRLYSLGDWFIMFWIIFLIASALLALLLYIIIIHKITQNIKKIKIFAIFDGTVMAISWVLMHTIDYMDIHDMGIFSTISSGFAWFMFF